MTLTLTLTFTHPRPTAAAQHPDPCTATNPAAPPSPSSPRTRRSGAANSVNALTSCTSDLEEQKSQQTRPRVQTTERPETESNEITQQRTLPNTAYYPPGWRATGPSERGRAHPGWRRLGAPNLNDLGPSRRTGVLRLPELLWGENLKGGGSAGWYGSGRARALVLFSQNTNRFLTRL